jgi:DNA-directed RNA polymerase specialized sigma24 family protein/ribosomal protein S27AE
MDPKVSHSVKKLRWNDKQLRPFLREWHNSNKVKATPEYVVRSYRNCSRCKNTRIVDHKERGEVACPKCDIGIDAGLLKYAEIVISNATRNDFKHMKRTDDISISVLNNGMSPELSDSETTAWESDEIDESPQRVMRDSSSLTSFRDMEVYRDIHNLTKELDESEKNVITNVDLKELSVKQYSEISGMSLQKINKLRNLALQKLRMMSGVNVKDLVKRIADKNKCSEEDIFEQSIGPGVVARAELFATLYDEGLTVEDIAKRFDVSEDRVVAAINRACIRESRSTH